MNKNKENSYPKPQFKPIVMLEPYDIYVAIRQQIAKWIRDQPTTLSLQENRDYRIDVSPLPASSKQEGYRVIVHCLRFFLKTRLFQRGNVFMLSNWTRHINSCVTKSHKAKDSFTQKPHAPLKMIRS